MSDADVAIIGGGLVGASAALALARAGRRVVLIEAAPPPASSATWDERCIGVNAASIEILGELGVWPAIRSAATPITATHVSEAGRFGVARFTAADAGLDALGCNTPLRAIHAALLDAVHAHPAIELRAPATVSGLVQDAEGVTLSLADGELRAALAVACDGAASPTRGLLGIDAERRDYGQTAVVSTVHVGRDHQGVAYERFTPDGPVALLPRATRVCTLVWTQPTAQATTSLSLEDAAFAAAAQAAFGRRLGTFSQIGRRMAFPLQRVLASQLVAGRVVLAGNAAQTLHPVVAQGFNLGLRDCAALAAVVGGEGDAGAAARLARYVALREGDRRHVAGFTDRLVRLFSNRLPLLAGLRHHGLLGLDLLPLAHRTVMLDSLGLPALARIRAEAGA